jgi:hypothetical protein
MLGDGRREKSSRLFFLEVRPHRVVQPLWVLGPFLVAVYGVSEVPPAAEHAKDMPLLGERLNVRPSLTMGELALQAGPIELVIGREFMQYLPSVVDSSQTTGDNLYLMKMLFHP